MKVWTGFLYYLTGMNYGETGDLYQCSTDGRYGRYYFSYNYNLVQFMQYCVNLTSYYQDFNQFIALGTGNPLLVNDVDLANTFRKFATEEPTHFGWCQDTFFYNTIVLYAQQDAVSRGLTFTDMNDYGDLIGSLASFYYEHYQTGISFTAFDNAVDAMIDYIVDPMTSTAMGDMLNAGYDVFVQTVAFYPWFRQRSAALSADPNDYLDLPQTEPTRPQNPTPPVPPSPPQPTAESTFWHLWFNLGLWQNN